MERRRAILQFKIKNKDTFLLNLAHMDFQKDNIERKCQNVKKKNEYIYKRIQYKCTDTDEV